MTSYINKLNYWEKKYICLTSIEWAKAVILMCWLTAVTY